MGHLATALENIAPIIAGLQFRNSLEVVPTTDRNTWCKWLWFVNPDCADTSAIGTPGASASLARFVVAVGRVRSQVEPFDRILEQDKICSVRQSEQAPLETSWTRCARSSLMPLSERGEQEPRNQNSCASAAGNFWHTRCAERLCGGAGFRIRRCGMMERSP
jgi:hypothetical protein